MSRSFGRTLTVLYPHQPSTVSDSLLRHGGLEFRCFPADVRGLPLAVTVGRRKPICAVGEPPRYSNTLCDVLPVAPVYFQAYALSLGPDVTQRKVSPCGEFKPPAPLPTAFPCRGRTCGIRTRNPRHAPHDSETGSLRETT